MRTARYTFRVETRKVKIVFVSVTIFFCIAYLACPLLRWIIHLKTIKLTEALTEYQKLEFYCAGAIFALGMLAFLWIYGKWKMFGFEWHLYDDGLRIFKNNQEIRHIPWENIAKIKQDYIIKDNKDGKKFLITLPPPVRRDMLKKIREIIDEKSRIEAPTKNQ